jgi:diacylglycerol O-acyltransferase
MNKPIAPLDLVWLLMESPTGTAHVGALMLFEKPPDRTALVPEIVEAYRQFRPTPPCDGVPELLTGGRPHFREVADWDPDYHVPHLSLPTGSSYHDLLRLVADLHEPMLDRDRPLFRFWIIDDVPGGRFAIYAKIHHSIVDGVSGLRMVYQGLSTSDDHAVPEPAFALPSATPTPAPPRPLLLRRITESIRKAVSQAGAVIQISMGMLRKALAAAVGADPVGNLPFFAHHAPTNEPLKRGRSYATLSLPLDEMRGVGHQFGATLNDVAATIVDAGLHAYCRESGSAFAHRFIATCPVSLRAVADETVGTRVSSMFARLGEPEATPVQRIRQVVESMATAKQELADMSPDGAMMFATVVAGLAGLTSLTHLDRLTRPVCNLAVSNVPGARETRYLNGARMLGLYPVPGLAGSIGLNVTLSSYHDHMDFGFMAYTSAIGDVAALADHTLQAYRELQAAAAGRGPRSLGTRP